VPEFATMGDSQYSFSLTTFSPSGKLVQIEYALTAVGAGQTSLGIKASNGVVIATEKKLPSILVDENSVLPLQTLGLSIVALFPLLHIGLSCSGTKDFLCKV
jgi:20S proteasome subunit alpha 2